MKLPRLRIGRFGAMEFPIAISEPGLGTITMFHDTDGYAPIRLLDAQGSLVTTNALGGPTYMPWTQAFPASVKNLSPGMYAVEATWDNGEVFRWEGMLAADASVEVHLVPGSVDAPVATNDVPFFSRTSTFIGAGLLIPFAIIVNLWLAARKRK